MLRACSLVYCTSKFDEGNNEFDSNAESMRSRRRKQAVSLQRGSREYRQRRSKWRIAEEERSSSKSGKSQSFRETDNNNNNNNNWKFEDDTYEEEEDEDDDEGDWSLDIRVALGLFGLGLPALFVGVPWLVGHPMALTMILAVVPLFQRVFGFAVELWNAASTFSRRKSRKRSGYRDGFYKSRRREGKSIVDDDEVEVEGDDGSSWEAEGEQPAEFGGWSQLEEDRKLMLQNTRRLNRGRVNRLRRKQLSLFWRVVLAVFPFLRSWGGFL